MGCSPQNTKRLMLEIKTIFGTRTFWLSKEKLISPFSLEIWDFEVFSTLQTYTYAESVQKFYIMKCDH